MTDTSPDRGIAVVTGAAHGFGREIARRLVDRGHRVLLTDLDAVAVTAAAAELDATGMVADARSAGDHRRVAEAAAELGPVTVWVNNAGMLGRARRGSSPTTTSR